MECEYKVVSPKELAALCVEMADDRKADNVVALEVGGTSGIADYFVLCTGNSEPHIRAITNRIGREARERYNLRPKQEGDVASRWVLLDFGAVVVHIMSPEMRELYRLESLWGDSPRVEAMEFLAKGPDAATK